MTLQDENNLLKWRRHNSYYYQWLEKIYRFVVRPGSRVLHVGCECGDLLAAVKPGYGVGVDGDEKAIDLAKKRFPHLKFIAADPQEMNLDDSDCQGFDYVLICNSIGEWDDIQRVLERIYPYTNEQTRIVITYYNYLWEWVLRLGSYLGLRRPRRHRERLICAVSEKNLACERIFQLHCFTAAWFSAV
jgi:ubiquinone/menaquinone biosynthesis C-methylase UbiE